MKKSYESPDLFLVSITFENILDITVSNDEVISSQIEGPDPGEEF